MKAKTLALSAIICGASILGINFSTVYAASKDLQTTKIEQNIETEQLSQTVRDRNKVIGAVLGVAAISAVASKDKHNSHHENYRRNDRHNPPRHNPAPHHHR